MQIKSIKRPWIKEGQRRYNPDPFYNSKAWKQTKNSFKLGTSTLSNGNQVSNTLCYECMDKHNKVVNGYAIDHIVRVKDGGSRTDHSNLQNLCESCHASKSAKEAQL